MNPLTVLTGAMIMRRLEQMTPMDDRVALDDAGRYRLRLDADRAAVDLRVDGAPHDMRVVGEDANYSKDERAVAIAPSSLSLQALIHLRQTTGHPVLLAEDGKVLGVCCETEIIRALAGRGSGGGG